MKKKKKKKKHTHTKKTNMVIYLCFRKEGKQAIYPADVVLFEGILVFYFKELLDMFHMKLFVDTDPDTRLSRRGRLVIMKTRPCIDRDF